MSSNGKYYVIVDGGADTGLKGGKTSIFLEHSLRKVTVGGFDDDMVQEGLSVGTMIALQRLSMKMEMSSS